ncbi:hypothetical protein P7D58_02400 [Enterococcus avium]|jgi:hypothetical protein|uniref:hypothetical protein n=1 Tax=Enterococcus avium TaxID=33945 RepID=UPI00288F6B71|nr:hypothetical protein [Enterococcus avium]MDT2392754.1 hypothetical protein [Enterococcus avium]MDT2416610.1 hypothetical protein [Enterococcus avium]MDT2429856.1 hypothetical protein [Enterococcus avium]MDT2438928.1 hypothetical protein [Enterococcus avium]MDT2451962.1 hypothetical protein [Enterococcus avium]
MSLSKEQRAHDLAIESVKIAYDLRKTEYLAIAQNEINAGNSVKIEIPFDPYNEYQAFYSAILSGLESDG